MNGCNNHIKPNKNYTLGNLGVLIPMYDADKDYIKNILDKLSDIEIKDIFKKYFVYLKNVKNNYDYFLKIKYHREKILNLIKDNINLIKKT